MRRRTVLAATALPLYAAAQSVAQPAEPWAQLVHAMQRPGQLDETTVEYLEGYTAELFFREEHTPAQRLSATLQAHVARLTKLLAGPPGTFEQRLMAVIGEALALAGWVAWDSGDLAASTRFYRQAEDAARYARDGALHACALGYRSYAIEAAGDMASARQALEGAQSHVRGEGSATTRAWLAAREAEVCAAAGDGTAALRALDRAMTAYDYAHPYRERSWTAFFIPCRLGSMAVATYARLDRPELGSTAEAVVASLPPADAKRNAVILGDVAGALIQRGVHERGAQLGHQALDHTIAHEATLGRQRLVRMRQVINPRKDVPVLADLDDRLAAHVG